MFDTLYIIYIEKIYLLNLRQTFQTGVLWAVSAVKIEVKLDVNVLLHLI